ncbi:neurotensin/neuromedin N-like [Scleropages formosus]|uniref:neurotensin/neuromedin N-like n=1 Tax=Scleropages formosus TaxID=113540 RepID=UPI000878D2DF|nr:neurotensin/neuromedin N [Scleropages formosus]
MRAHLVCIVILFSAYRGACSDAEQERRTAEEELLSRLFTSKVSERSLPFWWGTLRSVCELLSRWNEPLLESEAGIGAIERVSPLSSLLKELDGLQDLCGMLFPWALVPSGPRYPDPDQTDSESPPKRKSPYILKRQLHNSKARRPYILKRLASY